MSTHEFWEEEPSLFFVYLRSYRERMNEQAWLFGLYTHIAVSNSLANAFRDKNSKPSDYLDKPIDFEGKDKVTKQEVRDIATEHFNKQAKVTDLLKKIYNVQE